MRTAPIALAALLFGAPVRADLLIVTEQGNTIFPQEQTEISMDAETVLITQGQYSYQVSATFEMRSHSDRQIRARVAFPVVRPQYDEIMKESFRVEVREAGQPDAGFVVVPTSLRMKKETFSWEEKYRTYPKHEKLDYPGYLVWEVTWEPRQTRIIRCSYTAGAAHGFSRGLVDGWEVLYVVRTGALWRGPIGRADIRVRFSSDVRSNRTAKTPLVISYPEQAKWVSNREVRWSFHNWEPKEDIWVKSLAWVGLTTGSAARYFVQLPVPYAGASRAYDRAYLDGLVEQELAPWKRFFPAECARVDRRALRRVVAGWLYHEILARHGDPFLIGPCKERGKWPAGTATAMRGHCYGAWQTRFGNYYMYHGGWYRPKMNTRVKENELAPGERENLRRLKPQL